MLVLLQVVQSCFIIPWSLFLWFIRRSIDKILKLKMIITKNCTIYFRGNSINVTDTKKKRNSFPWWLKRVMEVAVITKMLRNQTSQMFFLKCFLPSFSK